MKVLAIGRVESVSAEFLATLLTWRTVDAFAIIPGEFFFAVHLFHHEASSFHETL